MLYHTKMQETEYSPYDPEAGFDHERPEDQGSEITSGYNTFMRFARHALQEYTGSTKEYLSKDQEWALSVRIGAGADAEARLEEAEQGKIKLKIAEYKKLQAQAADGKDAQEVLVLCNLRFAAYFARASMNIMPRPKPKVEDDEDEDDQDPLDEGFGGRGRIGAFSNVRNMRSRYADLDDRTQAANEGLIAAARTFRPRYDKDGNPDSVKFVTYAAYSIHHQLQYHQRTVEFTGAKIPTNRTDEIRNARKYPEQFTPEKRAELEAYEQRRHAQFLDDIELQVTAPEELEQDDESLAPLLEMAEIFADIQPDTAQIDMLSDHKRLQKLLAEKLETLSEREAGSLRLRYGLSDGQERTLDEIGTVYGVTRERIRQILNTTMTKMRHPVRSRELFPYLDQGAETNPGEYYALDAVALPNFRTQRPLGAKALEVVANDLRPDQQPRAVEESWQAYAGEDWDEPMRRTKEQLAAQFEVVTKKLRAILYDVPTSFFTTKDLERYMIDVQELVRETLGEELNASHIEHFWNYSIERFVAVKQRRAGDEFNLDAIGHLFSNLLAEYMREQSEVELTIPERLAGKLNYLGEGLRDGELTIRGDVGDFVGTKATNMAAIVVHGDVGSHAGADMRDYAVLEIHGDAGDYLGQRLRGDAHVMVMGSVGDYAAAGLRSRRASIQIEGDAGKAFGYYSSDGTLTVNGIVKTVLIERTFRGDLKAGHILQSGVIATKQEE